MSPTGYEVDTHRNIARIARALERIANVMEEEKYGVSSPRLEAIKKELGKNPSTKFCDQCQTWHLPPVSEAGVDGPDCPRQAVKS